MSSDARPNNGYLKARCRVAPAAGFLLPCAFLKGEAHAGTFSRHRSLNLERPKSPQPLEGVSLPGLRDGSNARCCGPPVAAGLLLPQAHAEKYIVPSTCWARSALYGDCTMSTAIMKALIALSTIVVTTLPGQAPAQYDAALARRYFLERNMSLSNPGGTPPHREEHGCSPSGTLPHRAVRPVAAVWLPVRYAG